MERFRLEGKTAIVTGALGLLGREHCRALAEAGAFVVALDTALEGAAVLRDELGNRLMTLAADVTDRASLVAARSRILAERGRIDVLVNNAAVNEAVECPARSHAFEDYPLDLWKRSLEVNVTGVFLTCQVFGSRMAEQRSGSIINLGSTYALVAPDQALYRSPSGEQTMVKSAAYPATKGAVLSLTRYLAAYWGGKGVRVNALVPGGVENGQPPFFIESYARRTPLGRMAAPSDYRGAVVFLASEASRYMTGAALVVDGGWTAW